jgi:hypothetical protein
MSLAYKLWNIAVVLRGGVRNAGSRVFDAVLKERCADAGFAQILVVIGQGHLPCGLATHDGSCPRKGSPDAPVQVARTFTSLRCLARLTAQATDAGPA